MLYVFICDTENAPVSRELFLDMHRGREYIQAVIACNRGDVNMAPKSSSGRRKSGAAAKVAPREMTPEEILQGNIKVTEQIAQRGFMPEGAIYYAGTPEQRTQYYEAVDRLYKRMPEGYGYSLQTRSRSHGYGKDRWTEVLHIIQLKQDSSSMMGSDAQILYWENEFLSRSAIRGYAKAQVYKAAGRIYDFSTKGASEKYPALDHYGHPKK